MKRQQQQFNEILISDVLLLQLYFPKSPTVKQSQIAACTSVNTASASVWFGSEAQQPLLMFRGRSKMQRPHVDPCGVRHTIVSATYSVGKVVQN